MYENSYHLFKEINPMRYARLTFYTILNKNEICLYCDKDICIKYEDKFYMYKGLVSYITSEPEKQFILLCKGKKTIHKINYDWGKK